MRFRLIAILLLPVLALSADVTPATTEPVDDSTPETTQLDNPFLPEDANIGDCISAVPRPECGSKARGGWRQGLVFGAIAVAVVVIGARLAVGVRRRDRLAAGSRPGPGHQV